MGVAGLVENKANSARPAKLKLAGSLGLAELGNIRKSQKNKLGVPIVDALKSYYQYVKKENPTQFYPNHQLKTYPKLYNVSKK